MDDIGGFVLLIVLLAAFLVPLIKTGIDVLKSDNTFEYKPTYRKVIEVILVVIISIAFVGLLIYIEFEYGQ